MIKKGKIKHSYGFFLFFMSGLLLIAHAHSQNVKVMVTADIEYKQTHYKAFAGDHKEISLVTYQTEINKGILSFRSSSNASFKEQIRIFSILLEEVLKQKKNNTFETLFIGGLISAFGAQNMQMSERLAMAAYESDLWDNIKGRPLTGHENSILQNLSNTFHIFPELSQVFLEHGFSIQVSGIEKVFINRSETLPFAESLKAKGVETSARLPYDCLTWFSISRAAAGVHLGGGYWKDRQGVYWRWPEKKYPPKGKPVQYIEKKLAGVDPDSFIFLAERVEGVWGKDKNGIYFFHEKMTEVDINTWEPLDMGYSKDKNFVFNGTVKLKGTDPKTFIIPFVDQ